MSDLVERIARDIAEEVGDPNWQNHAAAARRYIAEVRRFDVERGPSDAEVEGSCEPLRELRGEPGADAVLRIAAKIRQEEPV